jgi:hypothetical protein
MVVMKSSIFWDITPRRLLIGNQCFGGARRLRLQGLRISQASYSGVLLGLFLDSEDVGNVFLRNVGCMSTVCTTLCPRR